MFAENKYTTHFATHKNAQSQLVTVQCSLSKCQPENSKVQLVTPNTLIRIRSLLHFSITSSHSIRSPGQALCGRMNSLPLLNTRSTEADVEVMALVMVSASQKLSNLLLLVLCTTNSAVHSRRFEAPHFTLVKEALIEIGCVVTSLVVGWLVVTRVLWPNGASQAYSTMEH